MKICILTHTFPRNDSDVAAAFMKELCDGLVENNNKVSVVTPFDTEFKARKLNFNLYTYKYIWPLNLHKLGYSRSMVADVKIKKINYLLLPLMLIFGIICLFKVIQKEKPDIISVHWIIPNGLIALIVSKITGVPYTVTLPGTDTYLARKNKFFEFITKVIATNSTALFSNSSWHLNKITSLGIKKKYTQVITYPVDTNKFRPTKEKINEYKKKIGINDELVLFAIGRLVYKKGFIYLIKAIPTIIQRFSKVVLLIGGDGDLKNELQENARKLGVENSIKFLGTINRDEVNYYYNLADVMITPSIIDDKGNVDGRPLVILESMACGKAQIVTDLPGISDSLKDGENGFLVPEKDSIAIVEAVSKLIKSPKLRIKMGEANRKKALDELSMKQIGLKYTKAFEEVLNK